MAQLEPWRGGGGSTSKGKLEHDFGGWHFFHKQLFSRCSGLGRGVLWEYHCL